MAMMTTQEMFQHEVGDIYDAEHRFLKGQQEMLNKASDPQLQGLIRQHIEQTQQHIKNLDQVFGLLGQQPQGVMCDSAQGLVTEAHKAMQDAASDPIRDVLIDTAAAKVEHYEIASYRGLITDAQLMGQTEIQDLLQQAAGNGLVGRYPQPSGRNRANPADPTHNTFRSRRQPPKQIFFKSSSFMASSTRN